MSWRTAFTTLAGLSVSGVVTSYDLSTLPNTLSAAHLPALVPAFPQGRIGLGGDETGMSTLTYDGRSWVSTMEFDHMLVWEPSWSDSGLSAALPALVDAADAYISALALDGTLGGALDRELEIVQMRPGVVAFGGMRYYGVRFRHRWQRVIG